MVMVASQCLASRARVRYQPGFHLFVFHVRPFFGFLRNHREIACVREKEKRPRSQPRTSRPEDPSW